MAALLYSLALFTCIHILLLADNTVLILCQEEDLVYIGTGTNGSHDKISEDNQIVILGGLFAIHESAENNTCSQPKIFPIVVQHVEAMVLAVDMINHDETLLPGITLAYEIRDTCGLPNYALEQTVLSLFLSNKGLKNSTNMSISCMMGTSFSRVSLAVANLLRAFKIPQISSTVTSKILNENRFDYFFRMVPPDTQQALAMADIITHFNWSYIMGIYLDDSYGYEGIKTLNELLKSETHNVCSTDWLPIPVSASAEDFDEIVTKINKEWIANATVVVLFCHQKQAEGLFEAVLRRQETENEFALRNITWIGSEGWGKSVSPKYYNLVHGMLSTIPRVNLSEEFDKYFLSLHPSNNSANPWFNEYWEEIFNCSLGRREDIPICYVDNQIQSKENSDYSQHNFSPFVIDAVYAFAHAIHNMQQDHCPEGRGLCPEIVEINQLRTTLKGELLLQYLHNVSFNGTSVDRVQFNKNRYQQSGYDIFNLQMDSSGQFSFRKVGEWDDVIKSHGASLLIHDNIQWTHGLNGSDVPESVCSHPCANGEQKQFVIQQSACCWKCIPCKGANQISNGSECRECAEGYAPNMGRSECIFIEPTFISWSHPLSIIIIILAVLGLASNTFVAIVFIVYRKHHLIKASSRELTGVLICGIVLCYVVPFFYIVKPSPVVCGIQRFGVGFCFSLCFSALLVKTNRIHRIFNRNSISVHGIPLISPLSQLFLTFLLVSVQVVIVIVWLAAEHPSVKITYSNNINAVLTCGANVYIGLSVSLTYNAILLVITTYFSIRTRNVPENFNEAKFINMNMYTLCILWLAFIPSYFITAALNTSFHTSILLLAVVLSGTVIFFCLVVPKMYFLFLKKEASVKPQSSTKSSASMYTCNKVSSCSTSAVKSSSGGKDYLELCTTEERSLNRDDSVNQSKIQEGSSTRVDTTDENKCETGNVAIQADLDNQSQAKLCSIDKVDPSHVSIDHIDSIEQGYTSITLRQKSGTEEISTDIMNGLTKEQSVDQVNQVEVIY